MAKTEDVTSRLYALKSDRQGSARNEEGKNAGPEVDSQLRSFAKDRFTLIIYSVLGLAILGQLALILFMEWV